MFYFGIYLNHKKTILGYYNLSLILVDLTYISISYSNILLNRNTLFGDDTESSRKDNVINKP